MEKLCNFCFYNQDELLSKLATCRLRNNYNPTGTLLTTYSNEYVDECEIEYVADYMQLFYDCIPYEAGPSIGFTAHIPDTYDVISIEVMDFSAVALNHGNHYNPATRSFVCPVSGVYMFSVNICTYNDYLRARLHLNDEVLIYIQADHEDGDYDCSSFTLLAEARVGDVTWVQCDYGGFVYSGLYNSVFSGVLLDRLE